MKRRLWLVPLVALWTIVVVETYVRIVKPVQIQPRYVVDAPYGVRQNRPSMTYYHTSGLYRVRYDINSKGVRSDREIPYEKPDDRFRILVFGDSFGMSYESDLADAWTTRLEESLQGNHGCNAEVVNLSVSGHGTAEQLVTWRNEGFKYSPDLVLVEWHPTDLDDNLRSRLFRMKDGKLVPDQARYLPASLEQRLLEIAPYRFLAENSMFFAWARQSVSTRINRWLTERAEQVVEADTAKIVEAEAERMGIKPVYDETDPHVPLAIGLINAFREDVLGRSISFAILDIPSKIDRQTFESSFPKEADNSGDVFSPIADFDRNSEKDIYWNLPGGHFTPFGNRIVGEALARRLADQCKVSALDAGHDRQPTTGR